MSLKIMVASLAAAALISVPIARVSSGELNAPHTQPYHADADPRKDLADAKNKAIKEHRLVMVIFGANWCPDCLALHRNLNEGATQEYAQHNFEVVNVDVGEKDRNLDFAKDLGVTLKKGIPVAAILQDGKVIATTNQGELESSRHYSPQQILAFMHEIVENRRVVFPAAEHAP